jgi:hypothetical protein
MKNVATPYEEKMRLDTLKIEALRQANQFSGLKTKDVVATAAAYFKFLSAK